jgi:hypothetical protein
MAIEFVPLEKKHLDAVRRFNKRLVAGKAITPFLLDENAPPDLTETGRSRQVIALEESEVRGSFLEVIYPSTIAGVECEALNCQSPLSEGLVDQRYLMLPSQMFKVMQRRNPYVFVVGMGSLQNPLPRFLKAAGWSVEEIPFFYKVGRPSRFLRQMPALQRPTWKRSAAQVAALTGAGSLVFKWMNRGRVPNLGSWSIGEGTWGPWATDLWHRLRPRVRFGVTRDEQALRSLFRAKREIGPLVVKREGVVCGWSMALLTQMRDNPHFGNLRVATILDCIADEGSEVASIRLTADYLLSKSADIVISNQAFRPSQQAFLSAGFRQGPSNYVLATSPKLASAIGGEPVASGLIYVTRSDGDGRINL